MKALISCLLEALIPFVCGIPLIHQRENGHFLVDQSKLPHYSEENSQGSQLLARCFTMGALSIQVHLGCHLL